METWRFIGTLRNDDQMEIDLPLPRPAPQKKEKPLVERPQAKAKEQPREVEESQAALPLELSGEYTLPPLSLLEKNTEEDAEESEEALTQNARMLEAQMANFGVEGRVVKVSPGPVVTIYEMEPAVGVKTSKVVGLADDLARAMSATAIRIAPIHGKNVIGIEMPNRKRRTVRLRELLATEEFNAHHGKLVVPLGVDVGGKPTYADISKMPHTLIAGTTGSGKSVAVNAFILGLTYRMTPKELRFIMVDPKMLELSGYNGIPHLLTPVVTDPNKAAAALKWAVKEMENRYRMMSELGVKNIQSFNDKFAELQKEGKIPTRMVQTGFDVQTGRPMLEERPVATESLPYIVVIIDELADLMLVAGKQVEASIARLAQMARAAGLHLMVATQRPSVDVITGLIKANIPTRMSFHVTSKIDSRTILDQMGAEALLGKGDMLYMANGAPHLQRVHGAFVSEDECEKVAEHLKKQGQPQYIDTITVDTSAEGGATGGGEGNGVSPDDPLYRQAIDLVARERKASTSFIQRHLKIGYNRAATLIEQMERDGLVGPSDHVGKREVIMREPPADGY
jgi:S-DNA-T family DNA segregation ATPase FtsK/SpoIIIE